MLRFPNPGSDIRCLIRLFQSLFLELASAKSFSLDDMSKAMVMNNLAASCGRMGEEALERSTRDDRSRDPLYNQSKMYSELFRALGWITSAPDSRLNFRFTTLGAHVTFAGAAAEKLALGCIIGIAFPNPVLDIKFETSVRPFVCILRAMKALGGYMSRDEIILGPMSITDDRDPAVFNKMITDIKGFRASRKLRNHLDDLLKKRKIAKPTSENYTRFPLAVLKWSKWATTCDKKIYDGRSMRFYELTEYGLECAKKYEAMQDFRASDIDVNDDPALVKAIIENSFYSMLDQADFDMAPVDATIKTNEAILETAGYCTKNMIFSPFQELTQTQLEKYTNIPVIYSEEQSPATCSDDKTLQKSHAGVSVHQQVQLLAGSHAAITDAELDSVWKHSNNDIKKAVACFVELHRNDNKDIFYPLVARLFTVAGFPCETSRTGVNYQRWDASIELNGKYIPIEIKSPGEERQLSVKALRQAMENHIILQARLSEKSDKKHTSLAVGFQYPNDRAEVNELIKNVHDAFGIKIGVIDFTSLVTIAFCNAYTSKKMSPSDLENLYGFLDINS